MSRIGKLAINVPSGTEVTITAGFIKVKGPKGELKQELNKKIKVEIKENEVLVNPVNPDTKDGKAFWGLFRTLINNMVIGVNDGYEKKLEFKGVGYKMAVNDSNIHLNLGFSHPIEFPLPAGITAVVEGNSITIKGFDKQLVGEIAAQIRKMRKPEPYKGKGIRYSDEIIIRKAGKAAAK